MSRKDELIFDVVFQHVFNVFDFTAAKFQWRPLLLSFGLAHDAHGTQQWSQPWHRHQPLQLVPWAALLPRDLDELMEKKRNEEILKRIKEKKWKVLQKKEFNSAVGCTSSSCFCFCSFCSCFGPASLRAQSTTRSNSLGLSMFSSLNSLTVQHLTKNIEKHRKTT